MEGGQMKSKVLICIVLVCLITTNFNGNLTIGNDDENETETLDNSETYLQIEYEEPNQQINKIIRPNSTTLGFVDTGRR
jgi:hypothetical protein